MDSLRADLLPHAQGIDEGSVWDLTAPSTPTWITQGNRAFSVDIARWVHQRTTDPWSGTQATVQRATHRNPPYNAFLNLTAGQTVTLLSQPFWCWHGESTLPGNYVVAVATCNLTFRKRGETKFVEKTDVIALH